MRPDPAFSMISDDEARALRLAVRYAIRQGLATDGGDGLPLTNDSLLSVARKLGMDVGGDAA